MRAWLVAVVVATPAISWACPACAARSGPGIGVLGLVAGMIAVPYAIAVVAVRVIRRIDRGDSGT